jgi:hypothetical protein
MSYSLRFNTADAAAIDALDSIVAKSMKELHEWGGHIFRIGSGQQTKYIYSTPLQRTTQPRGGELPPARIPNLPGAKLVAVMHTHPFNEDTYEKPGDISSITKPPRFSDEDRTGRRALEVAMQNISPGPIDMYVIDIHNEVDVLEGKRGNQNERERMVRDCSDLTCI